MEVERVHLQYADSSNGTASARQAMAAPEDGTSSRHGLPSIRVNDRHLHEAANEAQRALQAAHADKLFLRAGKLVQLATEERQQRPAIVQIPEAALRDFLSQAAQFVKVTGVEVKAVSPPREIAQVLLARHNWQLRPLRGITEIPVLRQDGSVLATPGYDAATALIYAPAPALDVPPIPDAPTREHIQDAARFLLDEILVDFPFIDDGQGVSASRTNALALLLTPIVRPLVNDLAPLAVLDKPQQGTGAGLFAEIVSLIATGRPASMASAPHTDDEWRKRITAALAAGRTIIIIDNVDGPLNAPSLGAVLTAREWNDRRLARTEMLTLPHEATWMATGNNIVLLGDLPRRSYWIRMNARTARPWQRQGFKHDPLLVWVTAHRGEILAQLLTLARGWVVAGKPVASVPPLGNFNTWAQTIGGILAHAGVPGFLQNLIALYESLDTATTQWGIFLRAWHAAYGARALLLAEVVADLRSGKAAFHDLRESLPDDLVDDLYTRADRGTARLQRRLGTHFNKLVDRYFDGDLRVEKAGGAHHAVKWRVARGKGSAVEECRAGDSPDSPHAHNPMQNGIIDGPLPTTANSPTITDSPAVD
jgi:hypothetical protein